MYHMTFRSSCLICCAALAVLCHSCEDGANDSGKSSAKRLLELNLYPVVAKEYPKTTVDETAHKAYISVGFDYNIGNIPYTAKLSERAQILTKPTDLTNPSQLVIQAEDGSTQSYTVIATQVKGDLAKEVEPGSVTTARMRTLYRCADAFEGEFSIPETMPGVIIKMDNCDLVGSDYVEYSVFLLLKKTHLNNDLVGVYTLGKPTSLASGQISFEEGSSTKLFYTPSEGTITITEHDNSNKVISGAFVIKYKEGGGANPYPIYIASGTFVNIPYK